MIRISSSFFSTLETNPRIRANRGDSPFGY
jgi:hypothetical protein